MSTQSKVRWGVLSTAAIGTKKVIPAMQRGELSTVTAICSRDLAKAQEAAQSLNIPKAYGSYEELLADPDIDAIYNPLPNHLHVPWTIKAAEAGKHVLCEKPIALTVAEARTLLEARDRTGVQIGEALVIVHHPQWVRLRELLAEGRIGELRSIMGLFSYFKLDPTNIRNQADIGGGGLMDIGYYLIEAARLAFGAEPDRVIGTVDRDPTMHIDRLTSAMMQFGSAQAVFTCSTQLVPYQGLQFFGAKGRIQLDIPFNAPPDRSVRLLIDDGSDPFGAGVTTETFPAVDQYTLQGDAFSRAILDNTAPATPLEDAIATMSVIEAIFRSAETGQWETPA